MIVRDIAEYRGPASIVGGGSPGGSEDLGSQKVALVLSYHFHKVPCTIFRTLRSRGDGGSFWSYVPYAAAETRWDAYLSNWSMRSFSMARCQFSSMPPMWDASMSVRIRTGFVASGKDC